MSNSNTSGAYCTQRPSPVQSSWSTHTRSDSPMAETPQKHLVVDDVLSWKRSCPPLPDLLCRVGFRVHHAYSGGGRTWLRNPVTSPASPAHGQPEKPICAAGRPSWN